MSTTLRAESSTPSSASSAEGFAPMSTSTEPTVVHCRCMQPYFFMHCTPTDTRSAGFAKAGRDHPRFRGISACKFTVLRAGASDVQHSCQQPPESLQSRSPCHQPPRRSRLPPPSWGSCPQTSHRLRNRTQSVSNLPHLAAMGCQQNILGRAGNEILEYNHDGRVQLPRYDSVNLPSQSHRPAMSW